MSADSHRKQKLTQIFLPLILITLIIITVLIVLLREFQSGTPEFTVLTDVSAIIMIIPMLATSALVFLMIIAFFLLFNQTHQALSKFFPRINASTTKVNSILNRSAKIALKPFWVCEMGKSIIKFLFQRKK